MLGCAKYFPVEEAVKQTSNGAFLIDLDRNKATEAGKKAMRDVAQTRGFRVDLLA